MAVAALGCDVDDPAVLLARAELALDRARRFGDVNLETKALADAGLAHVQLGRMAEGMALLDEDRVEGVAPGPTALDRRHLGDAGDLLDTRARTAYRHRIEALRSEIDDAFETGAEEHAEVLQGELDQLVGQLAQAFGLGGRSRQASSACERARLNVTRALRAATAKLREAMPEAGTVLDRRLRTGLYCAYEPEDGDDLRWVVQP